MTRQRHEASIKRLDTRSGREFNKALFRVIADNGQLAFFTDDQIELIRHEMVSKEWSDHQFRKYQRKQIAALRSIAMQDETGRIEANMIGVCDE